MPAVDVAASASMHTHDVNPTVMYGRLRISSPIDAARAVHVCHSARLGKFRLARRSATMKMRKWTVP